VWDEQQVVRAAVAGDREALALIVRATQDDVARFCAYLSGGENDVSDLVQETYLRALRSLHRFEARASLRAWLLAIARRVCADAVRSARRRRDLVARVTATRADVVFEDAARGVALRLALARLSPERRETFVLTQIVGLSYAEAAAACGVPVGTVRSRVARARDDLRAELGEAAG
jgi:RNA polymerase sigma-70 factor (ECF subfamily)